MSLTAKTCRRIYDGPPTPLGKNRVPVGRMEYHVAALIVVDLNERSPMNLAQPGLVILGVAASTTSQQPWWYTPLISGLFALIGVLIAQGVILCLARRNDKRRSEPELLKHCAEFSAACGRLKRELSLKSAADRDLSSISQLNASHDALIIIATPEIEHAAERFIGLLQIVLDDEASGNEEEHRKHLSGLFQAHRQFTDAVRKHFNRPEKVYVAMPMIQVPEGKPPRRSGNKKSRRFTLGR